MSTTQFLKQLIIDAGKHVNLHLQETDIVIEKTKAVEFGDYATNVCLKYAKSIGISPRDLATQLIKHLQHPHLKKVEIAGPGFINFFLSSNTLAAVISTILEAGDQYGQSTVGQGKSVNIEFVSANPTGPMHLAHARAAALGDVVANLLSWVGYKVIKEFYINDAGAQIGHLARSLYVRYMELYGHTLPLPEDGYYGKDIVEIAQQLKLEVGDRFVEKYDDTFLTHYAVEAQLNRIKKD